MKEGKNNYFNGTNKSEPDLYLWIHVDEAVGSSCREDRSFHNFAMMKMVVILQASNLSNKIQTISHIKRPTSAAFGGLHFENLGNGSLNTDVNQLWPSKMESAALSNVRSLASKPTDSNIHMN